MDSLYDPVIDKLHKQAIGMNDRVITEQPNPPSIGWLLNRVSELEKELAVLREHIQHALSSDCCKGYVSVRKLEPTIKLLKHLVESRSAYAKTTTEHGQENRLCDEIARLERLIKDEK